MVPHQKVCRTSLPQGSNPRPLPWQCGVLTTRPPGESNKGMSYRGNINLRKGTSHRMLLIHLLRCFWPVVPAMEVRWGPHLATLGPSLAPQALPSHPTRSAEEPLGICDVWNINSLEAEFGYRFSLPPGICALAHVVQPLGRHRRRQRSVTLHSQGQAVTQGPYLKQSPMLGV